jgi:hypothetical protein
MHLLSYIVMAVGILLLAINSYDEIRGITRAPSRSASSRYSIVTIGSSHQIILKENTPDTFRNAMAYHWFRAVILVFAGFVMFKIDKGQERPDPTAPDADGKIDAELRKDELDEEMRKKNDKHKHPEP